MTDMTDIYLRLDAKGSFYYEAGLRPPPAPCQSPEQNNTLGTAQLHNHLRPLPDSHAAFIYMLEGRAVVSDVAADAHHCLILSSAAGEDGTWAASLKGCRKFLARDMTDTCFARICEVLQSAPNPPGPPSFFARPNLCMSLWFGKDLLLLACGKRWFGFGAGDSQRAASASSISGHVQ